MKYEFFDHTADVKFKAYGESLEEAFENAALATFEVMTTISKIKHNIVKEIHIKANSKEALLFDFLDELVFLLDTEGFILAKINNLKINDLELTATLIGDNADNYEVHTYVKAPTYNQMTINENPFWVQVVLDL
jgi:SHS2 domain-containing protein